MHRFYGLTSVMFELTSVCRNKTLWVFKSISKLQETYGNLLKALEVFPMKSVVSKIKFSSSYKMNSKSEISDDMITN